MSDLKGNKKPKAIDEELLEQASGGKKTGYEKDLERMKNESKKERKKRLKELEEFNQNHKTGTPSYP